MRHSIREVRNSSKIMKCTSLPLESQRYRFPCFVYLPSRSCSRRGRDPTKRFLSVVLDCEYLSNDKVNDEIHEMNIIG